jgi:thiol-disulfide isomerase/thioredoxin
MSADAPSPSDGLPDPEAVLDRLVELDAVDETPDGSLETTTAFEDVRRVYRDTYGHMEADGVATTVADLFGVSREEARRLLDADEVTREDVVAYLAMRSFADEDLDSATLAVMADLLVRVGPGSPVPDALTELTDETYESFLAENPDAVVTVWKHHCDPCEAMKSELPRILDAVPEGVAVAGVDGEEVVDFRRTFDVDAAPAVLCFVDGTFAWAETGRQRPGRLAERFDDCYGPDANGA